MIADIQLDPEQKFPTGSQKVVRPLRNTAVLGLNGGDIHCRLALCFVAKANHCALPARQGAFDSRGGPMKNGLKRSEERRVGKEWVRTCRSRGSPYHEKIKRTTHDHTIQLALKPKRPNTTTIHYSPNKFST